MFKAPPISSYLTAGAASAAGRSAVACSRQTDLAAVTNSLVTMTMEEPRGDNVVRPKVTRPALRPTK